MRQYYKAIKVNGKKKDEHRHLMEQHLGRKLSSKEVVHHKNGNKLNNDLSNLEVMSLSDHSRMHMKGYKPSPETIEKMRICGKNSKGNHKLSREQAIRAKEMVAMGFSRAAVARVYKIDRTSISRIVSGKGYKWI